MDIVNQFFNWCCQVLVVIGDFTGWGYELANIIIFVIVQPGLILLFFCLWIRVKILNGHYGRKTKRT